MISPLAPLAFPELPPIAGVTVATAAAGIRYPNRTDLLLVEMAEGTQAAGVFTTSLTASAPVLACREALKKGKARALIVNSGNSNAFTGKAGVKTVEQVVAQACELLDCQPFTVFTASTGVIGEQFEATKITDALPALHKQTSANAWAEAARAIMTTDTYPKMATRSTTIGSTRVTLNGIAKGSGMIAPDMATMLAFVFTDAAIPATDLQTMLEEANTSTFNCITVDGDTSTSDTLLAFATGKAAPLPNPPPLAQERRLIIPSPATQGSFREGGLSQNSIYGSFYSALHDLLQELALHIVKDGEGAEKLVTIQVTGAESDPAARRIGMSIANSPLVKTALAASDANWGRIVMAVGKAGEKADRDRLTITIGGVIVACNGMADPNYRESQIQSHMQGRDIQIEVDVGVGEGQAKVWTCDLTHRYIDINGSYRT